MYIQTHTHISIYGSVFVHMYAYVDPLVLIKNCYRTWKAASQNVLCISNSNLRKQPIYKDLDRHIKRQRLMSEIFFLHPHILQERASPPPATPQDPLLLWDPRLQLSPTASSFPSAAPHVAHRKPLNLPC